MVLLVSSKLSVQVFIVLGFVFEAIDVNSHKRVAVKRTQKVGNVVSREYEVLNKLKGCDNVVQMLDFFYSTDRKQRLIQNTVMEYCDCSLEDQLRLASERKQSIPIQQVKHYTWQIFNGLKEMHKNGVCHRDLKPENILL